MRTAEHRGIGPGCWPTEVGARAGRLRDCTVHHSRDRRGALALADGLVTGCLAARADTLTERERKSVGGGDIRAY